MLYENYQKRISKLARILARVVRFLPLTAAVLGVIVSVAAGYAVLKGMVVSTSCPTQTVYGETAEYKAAAFFSGIRYQHRAEGSDEWREGTPVTAGRYYVRAVAENAFGKPRYGKPAETVILPKEITVGVTDTALLYGSSFSLAGQTADGDSIACGKYIFRRTSAGSWEASAQYDVTPDAAHVRVRNADGVDVTSSYRILTAAASVAITKLQITVTVPDASKVYDGEKLTSERFEVTEGSLCEGDRLEGTFEDSVTAFGSVTNAPTFRIFNEFGEDVTEYYEAAYIYGKLTVEKRPVVIKTGSIQGVYSGEAFANGTFTVDAENAPIHGHTLIAEGEPPAFTNAGSYSNALRFRIVNEAGADMTDNYELHVEAGAVEIAPRPLNVTTESGTWIYDGKPHFADGYTAEGLLGGHTFDIFRSFEMTDVGEYANEILFAIRNAAGEDVTGNYEIVGNYGTCRIIPRPILITTKSKETVYDGTAQSYYGYTADGTAEGHNVQIITFTEETNAGVYPNLMDFVIRDAAGRDVTFNYELSIAYGTLTVKPRPLLVTTESKTWVYDGKEHTHSAYTVSGTVEPHDAVAVSFATVRNSGQMPNEIVMRVVDPDGTDLSANYEVVATWGTLTVEPRPITVRTDSGEWIYDSMPHGISSYTVISEMGLSVGDRLKIESAVTVTDVSAADNVPAVFDIVGADGESALGNYTVEWEYGKLSVSPRQISVKPVDRSKPYDGLPLFADGWEYTAQSAMGLVPWHSALLTYAGSQTEIGSSDSRITSVRITDGERDVTANYLIAAEVGALVVYGESDSSGGDVGTEAPVGQPTDDGFSDIRGERDAADAHVIVGEVMSEASGKLYLRKRSFGDYVNGIWTPGPSYDKLLPGGYNYNYLTSAALAANGLAPLTVSFRGMVSGLLPYYAGLAEGDYGKAGNDVSCGNLPESYSLEYYAPSASLRFEGLVGKLGEFAAYEEMYAREVYKNYLSVDPETRAYMENVIAEEGYSLSDPYAVKKIALYIRGAAEYNPDYDRAMNEEENIVVAFLEKYKQGDYRHYATAAVLLYRALGIPARYVEGYAVKASADEFVPVTGADAYAWVEVYTDGVGWVRVEVTENGSDGGFVEEDASLSPIRREHLSIEPNYRGKVYDGEPLYPSADDLKGNALFAALLSEGYTFKAEVSGSQTEAGQSVSVIESFRLFHPNGNDVTSAYEIELRTGLLKVFPSEKTVVRVYLYELQKYYDGAPLVFGADDWEIVSMEEGIELWLTPHISLTHAGALSLSDLNGEIDRYTVCRAIKDGEDVTERVLIEFVEIDGCGVSYMPIRIDRRTVELTAGSAEKIHDGEALTCEDVFVSLGSLAAGHWIDAKTEGALTEAGEEENEIVSVRIRDEAGKDVTDDYVISKKPGKLTVVAP